jgi:anti-anti-sigma factor
MEIREDRGGDGVLIVAPVGRVDSTTSEALERSLLRRLEQGERRLVLDLAGVEYISSAGLRVLLMLAKRLQQPPGALVLCALADGVRQVFELAGFLPLFAVEPSRERALARLAPGG